MNLNNSLFQLNAIELAWGFLKGRVAKTNAIFKIEILREEILRQFDEISTLVDEEGLSMFNKWCGHVYNFACIYDEVSYSIFLYSVKI